MSPETILQQPAASNGGDDVENLRKFFEKFMLEEGVGVEELRILFEKLMFSEEGAGVDELRKSIEEFMVNEAAGVEEKKEEDDESEEEAEENQREQKETIAARLKQRCAFRLPMLKLKSDRNTVPVPRQWCEEEHLEGVSRIEKPPYRLPSYIAATGIEKVRQIQREDSNKLGAVEIDYQVLYDAFFKYQTKPKLTAVGDLYYEGKEFDQVSLGDQMKKCGLREPVDETKHWGDLEEEEEEEEEEDDLDDDLVAENEKKRKRKIKGKQCKFNSKKKDFMF